MVGSKSSPLFSVSNGQAERAQSCACSSGSKLAPGRSLFAIQAHFKLLEVAFQFGDRTFITEYKASGAGSAVFI